MKHGSKIMVYLYQMKNNKPTITDTFSGYPSKSGSTYRLSDKDDYEFTLSKGTLEKLSIHSGTKHKGTAIMYSTSMDKHMEFLEKVINFKKNLYNSIQVAGELLKENNLPSSIN